MSEPKLISPMLDNFDMGEPISEHDGIRCCPAMEKESDNKYIVKVISVPASQLQLDALLLTGAYPDKESALSYFKELAEGVIDEAEILRRLSGLEGFVPYESWQVVPMEDGNGYDIYLLSTYRKTLDKLFHKDAMTHLAALNLGLDMCTALAVCRRSGYMYTDLKPNNIYIFDDNSFRIGDLGFLKLDSLKYASLPEKYHSQYTAPEITDAFSNLNATLDIYAIGLILYQAYNDGLLPFKGEKAPCEVFPAPAYADYEMAEIILKACAPSPDDRWQDPVEMGQALVSYMQRNGANDTPIVPVPVVEDVEVTEEAIESNSDEDTVVEEETLDANEGVPESSADTEQTPYTEDADGNLTFITNSEDETYPENESSEIEYDEVSDEVSGILTYADELIAHPAPEPVIPPEPIEVSVPVPVLTDEDTSEAETSEETDDISESEEQENDNSDSSDEAIEDTDDTDDESLDISKKSKGKIVRNIVLVLLLLGLLVGGYFFYQNYYLQPISIQLDGNEGVLSVIVTSKIDESKLTVICSDSYGNQLKEPVVNGKAQFTNLVPNSAYTIKVSIKGFHQLTGDTTTAYTTPVQTHISQFTAVTGPADGSVILSFTTEGPDASQWNITYFSNESEKKTVAFSGHMITISDLTIGSEYTFQLTPEKELYITGTDAINFTATAVVKALNLSVVDCSNGSLSVKWDVPENASVSSWAVRCYNENGYDKTVTVTEAAAKFDGIDHSVEYTVEVTAAGMSVSERTFISKNAITIREFQPDVTDPAKLVLKWDSGNIMPENGWILLYSVDGSASEKIVCNAGNLAEISPLIPGATYQFTLQTPDGSSVFNGLYSFTVPESGTFSGYGITAAQIDHFVCKTPSKPDWDRFDLAGTDYTSSFRSGENASLLLKSQIHSEITNDPVVTTVVVRDSEGNIVTSSCKTETWDDMWNSRFCEVDILDTPDAPGSYTVSLYFNGYFVKTVDFKIVAAS